MEWMTSFETSTYAELINPSEKYLNTRTEMSFMVTSVEYLEAWELY